MDILSELNKITAYTLFGGKIPDITHWKEILDYMYRGGLLMFFANGDALNRLGCPEEIRKKSEDIILSFSTYYFRILDIEREMTKMFSDNGMTMIVFKGTSTGEYYPDPVMRSYGDVDFFVRGKTIDDAVRLLEENGFKLSGEFVNSPRIRHYKFTKGGICFELHTRILVDESKDKNSLDKELNKAEPIYRDGVYYFDDRINGLILLYHIKQHFLRGLGIRQIADYICYSAKIVTDEYWENTLRESAEKYGLDKIAVYTAEAGEIFYGTPKRRYTENADEETCRGLIEYAYRSQNLGTGMDLMTRGMAAYSGNDNVFVKLQKAGMKNWKALEKHGWLKPFAWIYQSGRVVVRFIRENSKGVSTSQSAKDAQKIYKLAKELNIESEG